MIKDIEELKKLENEKYQEKANKLKFDEKIDDTYTKSVINKYNRGYQKNKWFISSGILSIAFGILCILGIIITCLVFFVRGEKYYGLNYDSEKLKLEICSIVFIFYGIFSILLGIKIKTFSLFTREMLMKKSASVMFYAVLQSIFGGIVFSIFTFAGYFVGRGIDYGAIYYNKIYDNDDKSKKEIEEIEFKELQNIKNDIFGDYNTDQK